MANRGAFKWQPGDSIFMIETIFGDDKSSYKLFPNESGFKSSLAALRQEIAHNLKWHTTTFPSWAAKSFKTYIMDKTDFKEFWTKP